MYYTAVEEACLTCINIRGGRLTLKNYRGKKGVRSLNTNRR